MTHLHGEPDMGVRATPRTRWIALLTMLALLVAACGGGRDDEKKAGATTTSAGGGGTTETTAAPIIDTSTCTGDMTTGISGDTIKIGTSLPQSGLYSAFSEILKGMQAYFAYLNDELGGVEVAGKKYKVELVDKDDEYQAEKTVTNVQELVNDEQVFALLNVVGTKNNLAVRDFLNEQCVPDLFAGTGSPAWGNHEYPWLVGSLLVPYPLEMKAFFDYLSANKPDAKVAILRAADDFGRSYSESFKKVAEGSGITIVKEETYNPEQFDTKSQITSLADTGADALIVAATLLACPDAIKNVAAAGWKPIIYMSGTCTSKTIMGMAADAGDKVLSAAPLMDPANSMYAGEESMKLYKEKVASFDSELDAANGIVAYGWSTAALFAELLSRSPALDRASVMETARTLTDVSGVGVMMSGQSLSTSADDWFLGENFNLVQYSLSDGFFSPVGDMIDESGKTASYAPDDLVNG